MKRSRMEFRITVKRAGREPRTVIRCSEGTARRYLRLLGPEPWKVYAGDDAEGDELQCCHGTAYDECNCGGLTHAEAAEEKRKEYTPLQWVRVESRRRTWELTPWADPKLSGATAAALVAVVANPNEPDAKWDGAIAEVPA